jgi:cytochrome c oxidase subunit III
MSSAFNQPLHSTLVKDERGNWNRGVISGPPGAQTKLLRNREGEPIRTGVWVGLATIGMMFAAFTSAAVVRQGSGEDWQHIVLPKILLFNTAVLILSSVTLEIARRKVAVYARGENASQIVPLAWLGSTLGLGLIFVVGQFVAWSQLKAQGVYLATSPTSSFFYVMTVVHALHVAGGLGGLTRVILKSSGHVFALRRSTLDGTTYYWHFMGALWMYLLLLLWLKF